MLAVELQRGRDKYLVQLAYQRDATYDRAVERDGKFRGLTVPYQIRVRHNYGQATAAGSLRLAFDGRGRLTRVAVQRMNPPFPFLQVPLQRWLAGFLHDEFSYRRLLRNSRS